MCHVAVSHDEIVVPDDGDAVPPSRAAIQTDELPENVIVADLQIGGLALVLEVLRIGPYGAVAVEMAPRANSGPAVNVNVGIQNAAGSNRGVRTDYAVGAYVGIGGDLTRIADDCGRMYGHGIQKEGGRP